MLFKIAEAPKMLKFTETEYNLVVNPMSRKDMVISVLRAAIIDGRLEGGQKLDQNEIAAEFKVSRMPVREALKQLESEGLVVVYPYRGVEVAGLDPNEMAQLFAIRGTLERLAVGRAVTRLGEADFTALRDILSAMDELPKNEEIPSWNRLNWAFHERINAACEWPLLVKSILTYREKLARYVRLYFSIRGRAQSQKDHWALMHALEARDVPQAQEIIEKHSNSTALMLLESIKESANLA
jgi:DNA-binding GntR family transcriptional regulator